MNFQPPAPALLRESMHEIAILDQFVTSATTASRKSVDYYNPLRKSGAEPMHILCTKGLHTPPVHFAQNHLNS